MNQPTASCACVAPTAPIREVRVTHPLAVVEAVEDSLVRV
jgi:hypothetical protein